MRILLAVAVLIVAGCGDGKALVDPGPTRYNFGIVDGANQSSVAGANQLPQPVTSQLTKDPNGKFANRLRDFILPLKAFAQGLQMPGTPVAGALVCAREAGPGEPTAFPLCAFTLADGKAPITVKGGTRAGSHWVRFSAQVQSQQPVTDSTIITVVAGPVASHKFSKGSGYLCWTVFPADFVVDQYGNPVPYRFVTAGPLAHVASDTLGSVGARTFVADRASTYTATSDHSGFFESQPVTVETATGTIAAGKIEVRGATCVDLHF